MGGATITVQVVHATPGGSWTVVLVLPTGVTVADAIRSAEVASRLRELPEPAGVAIHGRRVDGGTPLREGDRVELLRPLQADPKQARRARAARPGTD